MSNSNSLTGVTSDALILTSTGAEEIGDIRPGTEILTTDGSFETVKAVHSTKKVEQTVYKLTVPQLDSIYTKDMYLTPDLVVYGLPQASDLATEIAVSQLTDESFVFIPNEAKRLNPALSYHLQSSGVISDKSGSFVPIARIQKVNRKVRIMQVETESEAFVVNGVEVRY